MIASPYLHCSIKAFVQSFKHHYFAFYNSLNINLSINQVRMKTIFSLLAFGAGVAHATVQGFDISHYQSSVNFKSAYSSGARFVMIKVCIYILLHASRVVESK